MELWSALRARGALEKIILKFGDHGERQKGYAFAIFLTEEEACRALEQGRELRVGHGHVWLEQSQRNASLAVCDVPLMCRVDDLVCEMSSFGQVVDLDVGMVGGMRTAFVEFSSRKEAEIAKLQIQGYFLGIRGMKVAWVDSKFGEVKRIDLMKDSKGLYAGDGFVHFGNNLRGQISVLMLMGDKKEQVLRIDDSEIHIYLRNAIRRDQRYTLESLIGDKREEN
ncbi:MAG: hypothetical protein EZS28_021839 [Streblomastix strix]|uniref:RRM domain-containing protein n=1 Tax=Streblomastix strix TaxID=222440 RepID=A0A5J4VJM2_9EUKA|nr:MAG: hypothetical protein EZS28_021839 [Streblomastix strix]